MTEYITDDEQVERIKAWWKEYGRSVITGLVIGIGGLSGWRFWVDYQTTQAGEASIQFTEMMDAIGSDQNDTVISRANVLFADYASTPYADLARLSLAKVYVESDDYAQAAQQLQLLIDDTREQGLEMIARVRLAAVQMQMEQADAALATLNVAYPVPFTAAFEELKGDILVRQGDHDAAREAYLKARLANPSVADPQLLQRKLDDLGVSAATS